MRAIRAMRGVVSEHYFYYYIFRNLFSSGDLALWAFSKSNDLREHLPQLPSNADL